MPNNYMRSHNVKEIQTRLNESRGEILQQQIACEQLLTQILNYYYGGKNFPFQKRVHNDLVSDLTFSKKINLICKILKEYDWTNKEIKQTRKNLEYIRKVRNHMAHKQWHLITEHEIIFGLDDEKFTINKEFAKEFKKHVLQTEGPLIKFLFGEFKPFEDK